MKSTFLPSEQLINENHTENAPANPNYFNCLRGKDVITAQVSDHHPVIHHDILFWNVMMQGKMRNSRSGISFNNGFGIVENDQDYVKRLRKIAAVIAEIIYRYPTIKLISLCEGPIKLTDIEVLAHALKKYRSMQAFFIEMETILFHKPNLLGFSHWGLLVLCDRRYQINPIDHAFIKEAKLFEKLANRFQVWQLQKEEERRFLALAHFPFAGDEHATKKDELSPHGNQYCHLVQKVLHHYANESLIFCADFNLNPYLISEWQDRVMDQITHHNSILLTQTNPANSEIKTVTVDGVLLSRYEKQKYYSLQSKMGLFSQLTRENHLSQKYMKPLVEYASPNP